MAAQCVYTYDHTWRIDCLGMMDILFFLCVWMCVRVFERQKRESSESHERIEKSREKVRINRVQVKGECVHLKVLVVRYQQGLSLLLLRKRLLAKGKSHEFVITFSTQTHASIHWLYTYIHSLSSLSHLYFQHNILPSSDPLKMCDANRDFWDGFKIEL